MLARPIFEGRALPDAAACAALIRAGGDDRAWLVRAAVVHATVADAVVAASEALLTDDDASRGAALATLRALASRGSVPAVIEALRAAPERWIGALDREDPTRTLAQAALRLAIELAGPRRPAVADALRWAIAVPELRLDAWHALGADAPDAVLPHLGALLQATPALAEAVATRFALVHTERCEDACHAIAALPETTRRAFAAPLEKHLRRISAIRRWVGCRRILFGR